MSTPELLLIPSNRNTMICIARRPILLRDPLICIKGRRRALEIEERKTTYDPRKIGKFAFVEPFNPFAIPASYFDNVMDVSLGVSQMRRISEEVRIVISPALSN